MLHTVEQVVLPHRNPVADAGPGRRRPAVRRRVRADQGRAAGAAACTSASCSPATASGAAGGARGARPGGPTRSRSARLDRRRGRRRAAGDGGRDLPPWHPGRCAALRVGDWIVGHAGELHPKVVEALDLPARTCAVELDLDALPLRDDRPAPRVSPYPPVAVDVSLIAAADVPAAELAEALAIGGGDLLEDVRLFDVYTGEQVGQGRRSLAFTLRFRAPDRTLTSEEANAARDAAVAVAADRFGADAALTAIGTPARVSSAGGRGRRGRPPATRRRRARGPAPRP